MKELNVEESQGNTARSSRERKRGHMTLLNDLGVNVARKFERTGMMDGRKYKRGGGGGVK